MEIYNVKKTRKKIAKILTCWMPFRVYRRALRGIITLGVSRYFQILKNDRKTKFQNEIAIGAIMKDEGNYIKEWLDFHIMVGIKKFYLYDNGSSDNTYEIIKPYMDSGIVEYTQWLGLKQQGPAYVDIIRRHRNDTRWLALIDIDEFLVPMKHKTVAEFLKTLPNFAQLVVGWVNYGSNGHIAQPKGLVIENYKRHADNTWGLKSITNPRLVLEVSNPHSNYVAGFTIDENGKKRGRINEQFNPTTHNYLRCNHYATKSYDEFMWRWNRGSASKGKIKSSNGISDPEYNFKYRDRNDVYDDVMDKYIEKLKKIK